MGTATRFCQFDAAHHSAPLTERSGTSPPPLYEPGGKCPAFEHVLNTVGTSDADGRWFAGMPRSAASAALPAASQLIPMIGMTSMVHATVAEHPSEALESAFCTTNFVDPSPCAFATPYVVLPGCKLSAAFAASGAIPAQPCEPPG